ncbi:hypothetical protein [Azospirillum canadense]|uniref:hypothetical protein n=1 Tax=Azospirillum canadense TaxID=403962 RepID=UPI002227BACE|nr:hypothetical protein [Azospirillum canadense]MCW2240710.1 hypothetical protein [Azospirillum canadense]
MTNSFDDDDALLMSTPPDRSAKAGRPPIPQGTAMFDLSHAIPVDPEETYQEGDIFVYPDGVRFWRIEEVYDDGACSGPMVAADFPFVGEGWQVLMPEDMWAEQLRLVAGPSLPPTGPAN